MNSQNGPSYFREVAQKPADTAFEMSVSSQASDESVVRTEHWSQMSVTELFVLTTVVATAIVIFQTTGLYWSLNILVFFAFWKMPAGDSNPLLQALGHAIVAFIAAAVLGALFKVEPIVAIVPCCVAPAAAYLLGFYRGLLRCF